jgi:DNA-binding NarL/FixJ family response regulator
MPVTTTARNGTHPRPVRVLTVDDQPLFRDAVRAVLGAMTGFEALAEVTTGEDALALVERLQPDLVLLDINLPGIDGLETCRRLSAGRRAPLVVMISSDDDPALRESAADCGAIGFVPKQALRPGILRALWERHGGATAAITPPG